MGLPKNLTERQQKFAELLVYNEGARARASVLMRQGTRLDLDRQQASYEILKLHH